MITNRLRYADSRLSAADRATALLSEMTLQEKVAQLGAVRGGDLFDGTLGHKQFSPGKAQACIYDGIGHVSSVAGASMVRPNESAGLANAIQCFLVEQTRLGIPAIIHEESCAGYMAREATTFPQPIGLAATWSPELVRQMAHEIRLQMRAVGASQSLAPVLDVARDPRWGRTEETFGEDPFLVSALGVAYIRGLQGDDPAQGIVATAKHFVGYSVTEGGMNWAPAHITERELRETYLTPFKAALQQAKVGSVMNAYHEHDGIPCGSSRYLLQDILRGEFGFKGVLVSDYFTINQFVEYHRVAANKQEAAHLGLLAGIDVELPGKDCYSQPLLDGLATGSIDPALVDSSVHRMLTLKFQLGLFENPYVDEQRAIEVYNTRDQIDLSRELARQSVVLLKNDDHLLPLNSECKSIAVIGPSADSARLMQGDYHYPAHYEGVLGVPANPGIPVPIEQPIDIDWSGYFLQATTVLSGIRACVSPEAQIHYAAGCDITSRDTAGFAAAVAAARQSEVAIVVVGDRSGLTKNCTSGESRDSATLDLPGVQQQLVQAIYATGTPTIVVMLTGRPYAISWIAEHIPAIVQAWLPAQEGGAAIADILFGRVNPGGKLPISIPRHVGQIPVFYNHKPSGGRTHWHDHYTDLSAAPLYPFGHGLSYTEFTYADLHISPDHVDAESIVSISVAVTNSGSTAGDEVVQLYIHDVVASVTRPVHELKGFKRLHLQPGQSRTLTFRLDCRHLAFYDRDMRYVVEPGEVEVMVGSSSQDIRLRGSFVIAGSPTPVQQVFFTEVDCN